MDPVSAIGLTASLVQLIGTITKTIGYLNDIKNAPKERTQLSQETLSLLSLLMNLRDKVETADAKSPWYDRVCSLARPEGPLYQYKASLDGLAKLLDPGNGMKSVGKKLVWPLDKKKIHDALVMVERFKSLISIALQEDNFALSEAIKLEIDGLSTLSHEIKYDVAVLIEDVKTISTGIAEWSLDQKHQEVVRWLSTLNPASKQIDVLSRHQKGTGQWLLDSVQFQKWVAGEERLLWCPGMPGAGKTVLTAIVVDYLQQRFNRQDDTAVLFIYNDYNDQQTQSTANLIGALLQQIVQRSRNFSNELMALYEKHQEGRTPATVDELHEILFVEIRNLQKVFILVDALDEFLGSSGDRTPLIAQLQALFKERTSRLMITSRHNTSIESKLPTAVHIEVQASDEDVRNYVQSRLLEDSSMGFRVKLDHDLQQSIIDTLTRNSQGMFLSVELHLSALQKKQNKKDLRKALETLPKDLNNIYEETFKRISAQDRDDIELAMRVLSWLSYSHRPMKVEELQHALAVEPNTKRLDWDNIIEEDILVSVCGGLVTIEDKSRVIRLVHFTTQEYITSIRKSIFPNARLDLLVSCLTYLQYEVFTLEECERWKIPQHSFAADCICQKCLSERRRPSIYLLSKKTKCQCRRCLQCNALSFRRYAAENWIFCARGEPEQDPNIARLIIQLLSNKQARIHLINECATLSNRFHYKLWLSRDCGPLQIAALLGLNTIFLKLVDTGLEIDTPDANGYSTLHPAVYAGEREIVTLALRAGADINLQDRREMTPLMLAASSGDLTILRLLIDNGACMDVEDGHGRRALEYAAEFSDNAEAEDAVRLLLEMGATVKNHGLSTLHCARDKSVAQLMIENGADIEASYYGITPLVQAANYGRENVVRFLIEQGANTEPLRQYIATWRMPPRLEFLNKLLEETGHSKMTSGGQEVKETVSGPRE